MPLTGIVTIVLRMFSLLWLVDGVVSFIPLTQTAAFTESLHPSIWVFAVPATYLLCAVVTFLLSHPIARIVTPPPNAEVNLGTLTRYDLYCFALTFLGLYFFLSSFASGLNWLHYYIVSAQRGHDDPSVRVRTFYDLTRPLVTAFGGLTALLLAPRLARKLTTIQEKHDAA